RPPRAELTHCHVRRLLGRRPVLRDSKGADAAPLPSQCPRPTSEPTEKVSGTLPALLASVRAFGPSLKNEPACPSTPGCGTEVACATCTPSIRRPASQS